MTDSKTPDSPAPVLPVTPSPPARWEDLSLSPKLFELVQKAGFKAPTPIQVQAIPEAIQGKDIIASAQTGTGKTASFVFPMMERIKDRQGTYGLILAPTREIAQQIQGTLEQFAAPLGVRSIVLIGGIDYAIDAKAIQTYPQIIVGTPGRICDHLDRGNLWLEFIEMVVLDEADRMLDMGFTDQLNRILKECPTQRQTMMFSATFSAQVETLARKNLHNPTRIAVGRAMTAAHSVEQSLLWLHEDTKNRELRRLLKEEPGSTIVFTRSKDGASRVWRSLHSNGFYDATYLHSDRIQSDREKALQEFKDGKYRILIATDVAGRGIHVDGVAHVINYDLPMEPQDYVHRIGRTGRADSTGKATSLITPRDLRELRDIILTLKKTLPWAVTRTDEDLGPPPKIEAWLTGAPLEKHPAARGRRGGPSNGRTGSRDGRGGGGGSRSGGRSGGGGGSRGGSSGGGRSGSQNSGGNR